MRLRAGKTGSGTGAARMVAQAISTARMAGATGKIMVRGDSAYGSSRVVRACINARVEFSFVLIKNRLVQRAIDCIADDAWTSVRYPGAVRDPDTGTWISDAEVAEIPFTAFSSTAHPVTARLIVRRVKDARFLMHCSRCGGITRSSPTARCRRRPLMSPIGRTRSSRRCSPI